MSRNKFPPKPKYDPDTGPVYLYGLHTVRAALDNPRRERKALLVTPNALARLRETGEIGRVPITETTPKELDRLLGADAVHQGVALEVEPVSRFGLDDISPLRLVVVLDQVTDPHNVGAILRTACAFGADAVLYVLIKSYGSVYKVVASEAVVVLDAKLVDLRSGQLLWTGTARASTAEQQGNNQGGLVGLLVMAVIDQIASQMGDRSHPVAGIASHRLLSAGSHNGVLHGPRANKQTKPP